MRSSPKWGAIVAALSVAACGSGSSRSATTTVPGTGAKSEQLGVRVSVSCGDIPASNDFWVNVACGDGYSSGDVAVSPGAADPGIEAYFENVPADVDCLFSARATRHHANPEVDIHYSASFTRRFTPGEEDCQVLLTLRQDDNFAYLENTPPRIVGLAASQSTADVLGALLSAVQSALGFRPHALVLLHAELEDANGDALRTRWDDAGVGGTFVEYDLELLQHSLWSGASEDAWRSLRGALPSILWIPPLGMAGTARLGLTVEDEHTGSDGLTVHSRASLAAEVTIDDARAQVGFEGALNHWPDVLGMRVVIDADAAGGQVVPGERARLLATVKDLDGDPLEYRFVSECPGAFFDENGDHVSFPQLVSAYDEDGAAWVSVYFVAAEVPSSRTCPVILKLDDQRGGRNCGGLDVKVMSEKPIAYGPIVEQAYATVGRIGPDAEVSFGVVAASRYGSADLTYHIDLLSALAIPEEYLPEELQRGGFVGDTTGETGSFTWRSPPTAEACAEATEMNVGNILYFLITITDEPAVSNGVPAMSYLVIPVDLQCTIQPVSTEGTP